MPNTPSFLHLVPVFSALSADALAELEAQMLRRDFVPQGTIVREGSTDGAAFFILSGRVTVRRRDPETGVDFELATLGEGQMFGEMALLTGQPRAASVVALEATTCAVLEQPEFERMLAAHPELAVAIMRVLATRLVEANRHAGVDYINLAKIQIDPRVLALLPQQLLNAHKVIPIAFANNRLTLAMTNPGNLVAFDDVRRAIKGVMIEPAFVSDDDFKRFMSTTYPQLIAKTEAAVTKSQSGVTPRPAGAKPAAAVMVDLLESDLIRELQLASDNQEVVAETKQDLMSASEDAPIIKLVNSILGLAIKQGASDIHIEPMEGDVTVRFRIDGVLQVLQKLPKRVQLGVISRFKILSRLDIAEKRLPQDGRISVTMEGKPIDFRVSTLPGKWGEKVCMRLLDKSNTALGLDTLFTHAPVLATVREMIQQPHGIIYVTGPTGSGKTTTLYSALAEINEPGINISTAEDPIEYDLAGVNQVQVLSDIGLTFASVLRAFLRQDPDVILVGETRDKETAKTAVEAALTGHLVFTTLHTNSAAVAFTRLHEMGIEPFLVSSSTVGVVAQRLARRLCQQCKEPVTTDAVVSKFFDLPVGSTIYKAVGCSACGGKGVKGRVGIYEVLRMNARLRALVGEGARAEALHAAAVEHGMVDLRHYAAILLTAGQVSVDDVMSVVSVEE
jgi:type IV pilus assembly protein PilB